MNDPVLELSGVLASEGAKVTTVVVHPGQLALLFGRGRFGPLALVALGMRDPVEGTVTLLGQAIGPLDASKRRALRAQCGVLLERSILISNLSAFDNIALPLRYHRDDDEGGNQAKVDEALNAWDMAEIGDKRPYEIDVYDSIRVGLLRSLVSEPKLVVLENPFERLNDDQRNVVDAMIEAIQAGGAGILVIDA